MEEEGQESQPGFSESIIIEDESFDSTINLNEDYEFIRVVSQHEDMVAQLQLLYSLERLWTTKAESVKSIEHTKVAINWSSDAKGNIMLKEIFSLPVNNV
ncbi:unnamed protein product [Protopolystoma xenopodis]|uniref:Uncharacterized protein n=1 Tax=Protopolystoma xenopodis TaxID=117903 RepID=A0A448XT30_9PLAT|nr:unnamed protein product [Protopolystoma xenopodis]